MDGRAEVEAGGKETGKRRKRRRIGEGGGRGDESR